MAMGSCIVKKHCSLMRKTLLAHLTSLETSASFYHAYLGPCQGATFLIFKHLLVSLVGDPLPRTVKEEVCLRETNQKVYGTAPWH